MQQNNSTNDTDISDGVTRALEGHPPLQGLPIEAKVRQGCVTMSGTVRSWKQARDACRLAHTVEGVLQLRNNLVVEPSPAELRTDRELAVAAADAIRSNLLVSNDIRAAVKDGVITLEGTVRYDSERYDAEVALERLSGVRGVVNLVRVAAPAHIDLAAARAAAVEALKRHAASDGLGLALEQRGDDLRVSGWLDSAEEKRCVLIALRCTAGVRQLIDEIHVGSPSAPQSATR